MKNKLSNIGIILFFFLMLFFPGTVFLGASSGLQLWFQIVFPTLFPFLLVSNILLITNGLSYIAKAIGKPLALCFQFSSVSSFVLIAGFLCGYPVGAKLSADLYLNGQITKKEGEYLLSFCNNLSPGFILNYIVLKNLKQESLKLPTLIILFLTPCIISLFTRHYYSFCQTKISTNHLVHPVRFETITETIDYSILNSFKTLLQIGGYIILFSVLFSLLQYSPLPPYLLHLILPTLEVTTGISFLAALPLPFYYKYISLLALSSFGGFCAIAQTGCMIREAGFSLRHYIIEKLAAALTASLLGSLYLILFSRI